MISICCNNKSYLITSETVNESIKKEEQQRASQTVQSTGTTLAYTKYSYLYSYATRPYNTYQVNKGLQIFFYEWNDLTSQPKMFYTITAFKKFIAECGIVIQEESLKRVESATYGLFCTCIKGTNVAVAQYTFFALVGCWGYHSYISPELPSRFQTPAKTLMEQILERDFIDLDFFECSDLNRTPIHFTSWKAFVKFLTDNNIRISLHNEKRLKALCPKKKHYGSCLKGYPIVAVRDSVDKVKEAMSNAASSCDD